uniref:Uncharacterized protein n=1 Tax=Ficedula albicollis TaxID=59894 RepID=A0A803VUH2_FICAL
MEGDGQEFSSIRPALRTLGLPQTEGEPQPKGLPQTEGEPQPKGQPQTEGEPKPKGQPQTESEPNPKGLPQTEGEPNPKGQPQTEGEPKPKGLPQTESEDCPKTRGSGPFCCTKTSPERQEQFMGPATECGTRDALGNALGSSECCRDVGCGVLLLSSYVHGTARGQLPAPFPL